MTARALLRLLIAMSLLLVLAGCTSRGVPTSVTATATPQYDGWTGVASGQYNFALQRDGSLWGWDFNTDVIGHGDRQPKSHPTLISSARNWVAVATNNDSAAAIRSDGTLWMWGDIKGDDQQTLGETNFRPGATQVGQGHDWASVSCGDLGGGPPRSYTFAVTKNGGLWAWGNGFALSLPDQNDRSTPTRVGSESDWASVSCGTGNTIALKKDGTLWALGNPYGGAEGVSAVGPGPTQVGSASDWAAVSSGDGYSLALKRDGSLWATGANEFGQLGLGDTRTRYSFTRVGQTSDWKAVSAGDGPTLAIKTDGSLWAWGANDFGELGLGDFKSRSVPTRQATDTNWASVSDWGQCSGVKTDGTLWVWGDNVAVPTEVVPVMQATPSQ